MKSLLSTAECTVCNVDHFPQSDELTFCDRCVFMSNECIGILIIAPYTLIVCNKWNSKIVKGSYDVFPCVIQ